MYKECCPTKPGYHSCHFFVMNKEAIYHYQSPLTLSAPFPSVEDWDAISWSEDTWTLEGESGAFSIMKNLGTDKLYGSFHLKNSADNDDIVGEKFYHILPCGKGLNVLRKVNKENFLPLEEVPKANPSNFDF